MVAGSECSEYGSFLRIFQQRIEKMVANVRMQPSAGERVPVRMGKYSSKREMSILTFLCVVVLLS